ncbi:hypothetical protein F5878DRAFT_726817 [Lentinula raphanica]|uniref:F-box domain-containing protein n=1 Tax=Lentinula raphanica TaxID=153919 RepID=A0AA38UBW3_9AGAR|nr:hypothetical protein F5880DRAFT_1583209 [Lentinula raphanica]KAJ3836401.1 hypothetical protein F5878DRAFT_726817 [Lentinula raphanica]
MLSLNVGTDAEDIEIRREITHHEHSIASLHDEMQTLIRRVRQFELQIRNHEQEIRYLKGKITLARRLPPEILVYIFEICAIGGWTRAPLVVSQVCSEWRKAAQAPSVWSQVYVNVDNTSDPYRRTWLWLNKSVNVPIDITIDIRNYAGFTFETLALLLSQRTRWRSFALDSVYLAPVNNILDRCTGEFSNLRTLRVSIDEEFGSTDGLVEDDAMLHNLGAFSACPSLTSYVITRNVPIQSDIPTNITNLTIHLRGQSTISLSITTLLDILGGLPLLEEFSVSLSRAQFTSFSSSLDTERPITLLPSLKIMTLVGQPDLFALLQNIHTPTLQHLHLMSSAEAISVSHQWSGLTLFQWLTLGNTSLELLELRDVDIAQDIFIACFEILTKLRTLKLHDSEISDAVFESLHGDQGYCPELAVVDLRWCSVVTGRALVRFVRSRLKTSAAPIESVTVISCSFVQEQDILEMARNAVCRLIIDGHDYCRSIGCCENGRYRSRLKLKGFIVGIDEEQRRRLII